jgi:organic radical activating enzyme
MKIKELIDSIKDFFAQKQPIPPGMYTYHTPQGADQQYRLHLRVNKDGQGILVINAATVLHLNRTAVEFAYHFIQQIEDERAVNRIARRYRSDKDQIRLDYGAFLNKVELLITTPDLDPVTYLDIERQEPYTSEIDAPYRLDCALTYQINDDSHHEHTPLDRVSRELTTVEWQTVLQKAFENGVPHILFTGGEPTLRQDLPDLLLSAEELGLVTGLLSDGLRLEDEEYLELLLANGLDHLMFILDPANAQQWHILEKILSKDLFTTVHLTLHEGEDLKPSIKQLAELKVNALSLSEASKNLTEQLQNLRDYAAVMQINLVWDLPVPYSNNNPVALELENIADQEAPEGSGKAWLYVEPDGDVLPSQGMYQQVLGNLLSDPWEEIWKKAQAQGG